MPARCRAPRRRRPRQRPRRPGLPPTRLSGLLGAANGPPPEPPGKAIEDRYAALIAFVGKGPGAPIDNTLKLLNDLQQQLAKLAAAPAGGVAVLGAGDDPAQLLQAEGARAPQPVARWLQAMAISGNQLRGGGALDQAKKAFGAPGGPGSLCSKAVTGRFPFAPGSANDIPLDDFAKLFAAGGLLDKFFNDNLQTFVDTSGATWKAQPVAGVAPPVTPADLAQFQRASQIRDLFFGGGGNQPTVRFDITPIDTDAKQVTLDLDGQAIAYAHGPIRATSVTWPGPNRMNSARLIFDPPPSSGRAVLQATGPWALFRLFAQGTVQQGDAADRYTLSFSWATATCRSSCAPARCRTRSPPECSRTSSVRRCERLGFYGKIPARGDFVRAGLPRDFTDPWDAWLQSVHRGSRALMGEAWLPAFLEAPVWRFALPPGMCGAQAVARPDAAECGSRRPLLSADLCRAQSALALPRHRRGPGSTLRSRRPRRAGARFVAGRDCRHARFDPRPAGRRSPTRPTAVWWSDGSTRVKPARLTLRRLPDAATYAAMLGAETAGTDVGDDACHWNVRVVGMTAPALPLLGGTHPGARRTHNEDAFVDRPDLGIWAVADGAGGHAAGEVASGMIAEALRSDPAGLSASRAARRRSACAIDQTHTALREEAARRGPMSMVASTVVVMLARDDHFACRGPATCAPICCATACCGRSPATTAWCRSCSRPARSVRRRRSIIRAATSSPARSAPNSTSRLDKISDRLLPGDRFLLCSDGLCKSLPDDELARLLGAIGRLAAAGVIDAALARMPTTTSPRSRVDGWLSNRFAIRPIRRRPRRRGSLSGAFGIDQVVRLWPSRQVIAHGFGRAGNLWIACRYRLS